MIAQALRNFPARAGKHLSLVIVNAHCQPKENGCSSAIHKQKFRVSSFKFRGRKPHLALGIWHLAFGITQRRQPAWCFSTLAAANPIRFANSKLETASI